MSLEKNLKTEFTSRQEKDDDGSLSPEGEEVKMQYDIADLFRSETPISDEPDEAEIEAEREKYWKCPNCSEMVGIEFGVCWNCAAEVPELLEHPDTKEVLEEITPRRHYTPLSIGFRLMGAGVIIIVLDFFRHNSYGSAHWTHFAGYIFGGVFIVMGLAFILYSTFSKSGKD